MLQMADKNVLMHKERHSGVRETSKVIANKTNKDNHIPVSAKT